MCRILAAAICLAIAAPALAADAKQQAEACNAQAAALKEGERQEFLAGCLRGEGRPSANPGVQQLRAQECNRKAEGLKGDEKQRFLTDCLASKPQ